MLVHLHLLFVGGNAIYPFVQHTTHSSQRMPPSPSPRDVLSRHVSPLAQNFLLLGGGDDGVLDEDDANPSTLFRTTPVHSLALSPSWSTTLFPTDASLSLSPGHIHLPDPLESIRILGRTPPPGPMFANLNPFATADLASAAGDAIHENVSRINSLPRYTNWSMGDVALSPRFNGNSPLALLPSYATPLHNNENAAPDATDTQGDEPTSVLIGRGPRLLPPPPVVIPQAVAAIYGTGVENSDLSRDDADDLFNTFPQHGGMGGVGLDMYQAREFEGSPLAIDLDLRSTLPDVPSSLFSTRERRWSIDITHSEVSAIISESVQIAASEDEPSGRGRDEQSSTNIVEFTREEDVQSPVRSQEVPPERGEAFSSTRRDAGKGGKGGKGAKGAKGGKGRKSPPNALVTTLIAGSSFVMQEVVRANVFDADRRPFWESSSRSSDAFSPARVVPNNVVSPIQTRDVVTQYVDNVPTPQQPRYDTDAPVYARNLLARVESSSSRKRKVNSPPDSNSNYFVMATAHAAKKGRSMSQATSVQISQHSPPSPVLEQQQSTVRAPRNRSSKAQEAWFLCVNELFVNRKPSSELDRAIKSAFAV
jgi:hypothetical protein